MAFSAFEQAKRPRPACLPVTVLADLRAAVARIEERPVHRFAEASDPRSSAGGTGAGGSKRRTTLLPLGLDAADRALCGGIPRAGLVEVHGDETQGIGASTGFLLALAVLLGASPARPLLWIGTHLSYREAGRPYGPGLAAAGFDAGALLCVGTRRLSEAVWAAEEAARSGLPALAVLEARGNPALLGLEGTRRLHLRAREAGTAFVLLRQGGRAEATAAPLRLRVAAGPSRPVPDLPDLARLVGRPVFSLGVEKAPGGRPEQVLVEWNAHDRRFEAADRAGRTDARPFLSPSADRQDPPGRARAILAMRGPG